MTRKDVMEAVKATEPQGTPQEYVDAVFRTLGVDEYQMPREVRPVWSALWKCPDGDCGFVSRVIVNDKTTFFSTDSQGRDRRLPVAGKTFYALPSGG